METKSGRGRRTRMTEPLDEGAVMRLEEGFRLGLDDEDACAYAEVNPSSLQVYCRKNPVFAERRDTLRHSVKMQAKINLANKIRGGDMDVTKWYLERRCRGEFSPKVEAGPKTEGEILVTLTEPLRELAR